jgi:hypothetical protein
MKLMYKLLLVIKPIGLAWLLAPWVVDDLHFSLCGVENLVHQIELILLFVM